jgi:hypothetical protein
MADDTTNPPPPPPPPHPDLRSLERLVGTWTVAGGAQGQVTYQWMDGGFFLLQHVQLEQDGQQIKGIEIIGHQRPLGAEPSHDITSRFYDSLGNTLDYVYELAGDTLTIWGGERGSPAYYQGSFSDDGNTVTGEWVSGWRRLPLHRDQDRSLAPVHSPDPEATQGEMGAPISPARAVDASAAACQPHSSGRATGDGRQPRTTTLDGDGSAGRRRWAGCWSWPGSWSCSAVACWRPGDLEVKPAAASKVAAKLMAAPKRLLILLSLAQTRSRPMGSNRDLSPTCRRRVKTDHLPAAGC